MQPLVITQKSEMMRTNLDDVERLALLVGSLSHDLDHRGTNNQFQIKYVHAERVAFRLVRLSTRFTFPLTQQECWVSGTAEDRWSGLGQLQTRLSGLRQPRTTWSGLGQLKTGGRVWDSCRQGCRV